MPAATQKKKKEDTIPVKGYSTFEPPHVSVGVVSAASMSSPGVPNRSRLASPRWRGFLPLAVLFILWAMYYTSSLGRGGATPVSPASPNIETMPQRNTDVRLRTTDDFSKAMSDRYFVASAVAYCKEFGRMQSVNMKVLKVRVYYIILYIYIYIYYIVCYTHIFFIYIYMIYIYIYIYVYDILFIMYIIYNI